MAELPVDLADGLNERLAKLLDVEGKIARALDALGPIAGRDVVLVDGDGPAGNCAASAPGCAARGRLRRRWGDRGSTPPTPRPMS